MAVKNFCVKSLILPQFFPCQWRHDTGVYGIDFADLFSLGFVLREEGGYSYILQDQIHEFDIPPEEFLDASLYNLSSLKEGVQLHIGHPPGATVLWITADDNFASVRLLLPKVQEEICNRIGAKFYFTIAARDIVSAWNPDAPVELTKKHLREAREDCESDEHSLSPHGYVYSPTWPCKRISNKVV